MKCIYYKESLPCKSQEHIIPAALGGITKLSIGIVSDKANAKFSPVELSILRSSFLAINRENVGPGKRGSLSVKKIKDPQVRVLQDYITGTDSYKLGFIFAGQTYMIPQLVIDFDDINHTYIPLFLATYFEQEGKELLITFKEGLIDFLSDPNRVFSLLGMPFKTSKHFILIGQYNKKWFAATSHKVINMDWLAFFMMDEIKNIELHEILPKTMSNIEQHYKWGFEVDINLYFFLYLKTAFNACAYFIGEECILRDCFDPIREAILNNSNCGDFHESFDLYTMWRKVYEKIPDMGHYVIIESTNKEINAYVGFYAEHVCTKVLLSPQPIDNFFTKILICDWKHRNEFIVCLSDIDYK